MAWIKSIVHVLETMFPVYYANDFAIENFMYSGLTQKDNDAEESQARRIVVLFNAVIYSANVCSN